MKPACRAKSPGIGRFANDIPNDWRRLAILWANLVIFLAIAGARTPALADANLTGKWTGTSIVRCGGRENRISRCNALQNITLDFKQAGAKISGKYTCAFGTQNCLNLHEKGDLVGGSFDGSNLMFTVDFRTGATCRFNGAIASGKGQGSYSCTGTGGREHGTWRINRAGMGPVPKSEKVAPALRQYLP